MIFSYTIDEVTPYIDWTYFYHAWGFPPRPDSIEAKQLRKEANRTLGMLGKDFQAKSMIRLCESFSDGDNLVLDGVTLPLLRQQTQKKENSPYLCLSDFVRPLSAGIPDIVGVFASTVSDGMEKKFENDPYKHLLIQTLADRLAEAATEKTHAYFRRITGSRPENVQSIRPAVGYPSLPDQSVNFILDDLLNMKDFGITLTENGAMHPHSSISGLMISHPGAVYFSIGRIGEDQLMDYAGRREMPVGILKKFLAGNL